jgi:hypothetical protein
MRAFLFAAAAAAVLAATPALAQVHPETLNQIADEGFNRGQVVSTVEYMSDQIGGRMTNSPAMRKAEAWTAGKFTEWGLANVHKEGFDFGRGWWIEDASVRMIAPRPILLHSIPVAWTPPTNGPVKGEIIVAPMAREADLDKWKGKLAGKIVLITAPTDPRDNTTPPFERLTDADIAKLDTYRLPEYDPEREKAGAGRATFSMKRDAFLKAEGALAWAQMSRSDGDLVHGEGAGFRVGATPAMPGVEIGAEDYRRLVRLAKSGPVVVEVNSNVHYDDSDPKAYNVIAEIPGSDPKAGYVMAGAHLDSWVAGDGAADNGAGSAVVMEAARILAALHVKPKRTIRFALWAGEEEGLIGSWAYVNQHLATRPASKDPARAALPAYYQGNNFPITTLPGYGDLHGYFNLDNGSGKIRGVYAEGNFAAVPQLKEWLAPFASLGASAVVAEPTGSTDHVFFERVGLPGFEFIQDPLDYESQVHHTNLDTFDHLRPQDLRQASVIMAAVLLQAADSDKPLPGNVVPTQPTAANPFVNADPNDPTRR